MLGLNHEEVSKMDKIIRNSILTALAFVILTGGTLLSPLMILRSDQYGICAILLVVISLASFYWILAKVDPESINSPFT